jgi:hypothetical protein
MARAGGITNAVNVGIAVQADWENREFISHISLNVRRLFDFLVQFGTESGYHLRIIPISSVFGFAFFENPFEDRFLLRVLI